MSAETDLLDMGAWEQVRIGCLEILQSARDLAHTAEDPFASDEIRHHARKLLDVMDRVELLQMAQEAMSEAVRELARLAGTTPYVPIPGLEGRCPHGVHHHQQQCARCAFEPWPG